MVSRSCLVVSWCQSGFSSVFQWGPGVSRGVSVVSISQPSGGVQCVPLGGGLSRSVSALSRGVVPVALCV